MLCLEVLLTAFKLAFHIYPAIPSSRWQKRRHRHNIGMCPQSVRKSMVAQVWDAEIRSSDETSGDKLGYMLPEEKEQRNSSSCLSGPMVTGSTEGQ